MAKSFYLSVASASESYYEGDAFSVSVPTTAGHLQILADHEPLVVALAPGEVRYETESGTQRVAVESGVVEIAHNHCAVLL